MTALATRTERVTYRFDAEGLAKATAGLDCEIATAAQLAASDLANAGPEDAEFLAERLRTLKNLSRDIEEAYKVAREPLRTLEATIAGLFKPYRDLVGQAVGVYDKALKAYTMAKAEQRRAALAAANQAAQQRDHEALRTSLTTAQEALPKKLEGVSHRMVWVVDTTDVSKMPPEYLLPDVGKLNKVAGAYVAGDGCEPPKVPGVTFKLEARSRVSR